MKYVLLSKEYITISKVSLEIMTKFNIHIKRVVRHLESASILYRYIGT